MIIPSQVGGIIERKMKQLTGTTRHIDKVDLYTNMTYAQNDFFSLVLSNRKFHIMTDEKTITPVLNQTEYTLPLTYIAPIAATWKYPASDASPNLYPFKYAEPAQFERFLASRGPNVKFTIPCTQPYLNYDFRITGQSLAVWTSVVNLLTMSGKPQTIDAEFRIVYFFSPHPLFTSTVAAVDATAKTLTTNYGDMKGDFEYQPNYYEKARLFISISDAAKGRILEVASNTVGASSTVFTCTDDSDLTGIVIDDTVEVVSRVPERFHELIVLLTIQKLVTVTNPELAARLFDHINRQQNRVKREIPYPGGIHFG